MHFTSFLEEGRLTVALTGEIDHHCAKAYIQAIAAKIEAYTPEVCVLDFQEVSFRHCRGHQRLKEHDTDRGAAASDGHCAPAHAGVPGVGY